MQKNILFSTILTVFILGLYGCSCSQSSKNSHDLAPGLYLSEVSFDEGNSGTTAAISFSVTLQRETSDEVTVNYAVSAIDPAGRTAEEVADFAVVGVDTTNPEVDVLSSTGTITFTSGGDSVIQTNIELVGDTIYEHDEKFQITLSAASAGVNIVKGSVEAVIKNDDPTPKVTMVASSNNIGEVFSGIGLAAGISTDPLNNAEITLTLDNASRVDAAAILSGVGSTSVDVLSGADFRIDYLLSQGGNVLYANVPVVIPAGEMTAVVSLIAVDDGLIEGVEGFKLSLSGAVDVESNSTPIQFTVTDNDTALKVSKVNDTGLIESIGGLSTLREAESDVSHGVDKTLPVKTGGGRAGFDYTRYDSNGVETNAAVYYDADSNKVVPWECVKDNVSGLVWEVKSPGEGVRYAGHNYYWYDPNNMTNGGDLGNIGNSICVTGSSLLSECNTAHYVADVNQMKLCGMTGWRLPTIEELRTLVDYGIYPGTDVGQSSVAYDTDYFAGDTTAGSFVWSSTTDAQSTTKARAIRFRTPGFEESRSKGNSTLSAVRLVNDSLLVAQ